MRVVHVLRKPLSEGTVAANTLRHGCGGLNIDASRIGTEQVPINRLEVWSGFGQKERPAYVATTSTGRWPANVILQHLDGCRCYGDADGKETVANWICVEGCPVKALDEQSGVTKGVVRQPTGKAVYPTDGVAVNWNSNSVLDNTVRGFGDVGGASRFYKQVGGRDE